VIDWNGKGGVVWLAKSLLVKNSWLEPVVLKLLDASKVLLFQQRSNDRQICLGDGDGSGIL
jgi:hypothetical protein